MEAAILARDFEVFGRITMQDSNQFHAVCADTYPPVFYMNDTSRAIVGLVHKINDAAGRVKAAYTFDAGPNAVVFVDGDDATEEVLRVVVDHFPPAEGEDTYGARRRGGGGGGGVEADLGCGRVVHYDGPEDREVTLYCGHLGVRLDVVGYGQGHVMVDQAVDALVVVWL